MKERETLSELKKSELSLNNHILLLKISVSKQSRESDMYAVGEILFFIADHGKYSV